MAVSDLTISYSQLQREVARFLGWDRDPTNWDATQTTDFGDILSAGLRRFYFPPPLQAGKPRHEWSFLRQNATINLAVGTHTYALPDDFSGVIVDNSVAFSAGSGNSRLLKLPTSDLEVLQSKDAQSGTPSYYTIRPKTHAPATGHLFEMLVYPTPDAVLTLSYRYAVAADSLTASNIYHYGGAAHSETLREAILSTAEEMIDDDANGLHFQRFMVALGASIRLDEEHRKSDSGESS